MTDKTEAEAIAELAGERDRKPFTIELDAPDGETHPLLLLPQAGGNWTVLSVKKNMDEWRTEPERRKGTARLTEVESFIAHLNRFKEEHSCIFVDRNPKAPSMLAVLDYHEALKPTQLFGGGVRQDGRPRFGEHRSHYAFPVSDAWKIWSSMNGHEFDQGAFAQFIEDNLADVAVPEVARESARAQTFMATFRCNFGGPEKILQLSRGLTVHVGDKVEQYMDPATGEGRLRFESQHTTTVGGEQVPVPSAFILTIPVFREGTVYIMVARFRYRVKGGSATFWYNLHRPEQIFDDAIAGVVEMVKAATGLPVLAGAPES
jgi:uncharacterized protein DUF2303